MFRKKTMSGSASGRCRHAAIVRTKREKTSAATPSSSMNLLTEMKKMGMDVDLRVGHVLAERRRLADVDDVRWVRERSPARRDGERGAEDSAHLGGVWMSPTARVSNAASSASDVVRSTRRRARVPTANSSACSFWAETGRRS